MKKSEKEMFLKVIGSKIKAFFGTVLSEFPGKDYPMNSTESSISLIISPDSKREL